MEVFIEVVGWIGVVLILSSYALLSLEKLGPKSPIYQWMNVVGAAGFIINSGAKEVGGYGGVVRWGEGGYGGVGGWDTHIFCFTK